VKPTAIPIKIGKNNSLIPDLTGIAVLQFQIKTGKQDVSSLASGGGDNKAIPL
jgi:hypothetical protein